MCDTYIALPTVTSDRSIIFGKNSDREFNEAQVLEYHPSARYRHKESVKLTYLAIPQIEETLAVLISRPFWMWGAEMGANEKGVVIGNEAVWTKMPLTREKGLTGMDILRLALERGRSAQNALDIIVQLLSDYGQGGICGYEDKRLVYHNSYIIADPQEAWVLETAGPLWAALKIEHAYSISNGLSIGEKFDAYHPDLISTARKKGWLKKGRLFHFAQCYSDWFYTTFSASRRRKSRSMDLLEKNEKRIDPALAMSVLRDHEVQEYRPDSHFLANRICAHAANPLSRKGMQSTGSFVAHLKPGSQTYWATGTSAPCISIFKPIWFGGQVLPDLGTAPRGVYDSHSSFWEHEILHRSVLQNYGERLKLFAAERDSWEQKFLDEAAGLSPDKRSAFSAQAFQNTREATKSWIQKVQALPDKTRGNWIYKNYLARQNKKAGITPFLRGL